MNAEQIKQEATNQINRKTETLRRRLANRADEAKQQELDKIEKGAEILLAIEDAAFWQPLCAGVAWDLVAVEFATNGKQTAQQLLSKAR